MQFEEFQKMARLTREVIITEKIDGTNAQIGIRARAPHEDLPETAVAITDDLVIYAGSRTRWIQPGHDNFGFAAWVRDHAEELAQLGPGRHFGEWWGVGIQRGYGLSEKRFSLFNTIRWCAHDAEPQTFPTADPRVVKAQERAPACCSLVPVLYRGLFQTAMVDHMLDRLRAEGSLAAPGFMKPEGVVVFHTACGTAFKKTLEKDDQPKSKVA